MSLTPRLGKRGGYAKVSQGVICVLRALSSKIKKTAEPNNAPHFTYKKKKLIKHIEKYDGFLLREGRRHSIYQRGRLKTEVPRHNELVDELARKICKDLDIPFVR